MEKSKILFKDSLNFVMNNFWRLISLFVILVAFQFFIGLITNLLDALDASMSIIAIKVFFLFISYGINFWVISIIYTYIYQKLENTQTKFFDLFNFDKQKVWNLYVVAFLSGLIIWGGFTFFIIPGIFLGILGSFAIFLVIIKKIKPIDAIVHSFNMIWGRTWIFIGKSIYPLLYFLLFFSVFGIGLFLSFFLASISKISSLILFIIPGLIASICLVILILSYYVYNIKMYNEFDKTAPVLEQPRYAILKKRFTILAGIGLISSISLSLLIALI